MRDIGDHVQRTPPTLTIVVAAYNAEQTLAAALESVLQQGYAGWEIIIVDDGSTDETLRVAHEYARRDSRIRVIHQENAGAGAARNAAIRLVESDYVGYLDADDLLSADHMEVMLRFMGEYPGRDIYSSDGLFVYEDGSTDLVFHYGEVVSLEIDDMLMACRILGGGALIRSEAMRELGGFREHLYGEDYDLWLRALARGYTHVGTPDALYIYHLSIEGQKSKDPEAGQRSAVTALSDLIESGQLSSRQIARARRGIAQYADFKANAHLEHQAQRLRSAVVKIAGARNAQRVLAVIHPVSWMVRPLRRWWARRQE